MRNRLFHGFISFILVLIVLSSCKKEDIYSLYSSNSKIKFDYDDNTKTIGFSNIYDESINWNISNGDDYFEFSKRSGSLSSKEAQEIEVSLKRSNIANDSISTKIYLKSNKGDQLVFDVFINSFPEKKIRLDFSISTSAFNPVRNEIYFLTSSYSDFDVAVYSLGDQTIKKYNIDESSSYYYSNISVSPNGDKAVLYRYNAAIIIDLLTMDIIESLYIEDNISSAVYSSNDIVYFVVDDYYNDMYYYNVLTNELNITDIGLNSYDDYFAIIHPNGKYLYLFDDDYYSNNRILKLNIESEIPVKVYDEYLDNIKTPVWFNQFGNKMIFASKYIGDVSADSQGFDIDNMQQINSQASVISGFCQNKLNDNYYIDFTYSTSSFKQNEISVYSDEMEYIKSIVSEDFISVSGYTGDYQYVDARIVNCYYSQQYGLILITTPSSGSSHIAIEVIQE